MPIKRISTVEAMGKIRNSQGRFLSVGFQKRSTGLDRKITGRIGVKKNVKGVGLKYNLDEKKLFTFWDKDAEIHKSIPTNITALNINKEQFIVEGEE
jgi:hypothetical protein